MKPKLLFIGMLLWGLSMVSQEQPSTKTKSGKKEIKKAIRIKKHQSKQVINTNVFTLDLSEPSRKSMQSSERTRRLSFRSRDLLQFKVIGGNPFKYKYVLNNRFVDFFEDKSKNPLDINSIDKKTDDIPKSQDAKNVIKENKSNLSKSKNDSINIVKLVKDTIKSKNFISNLQAQYDNLIKEKSKKNTKKINKLQLINISLLKESNNLKNIKDKLYKTQYDSKRKKYIPLGKYAEELTKNYNISNEDEDKNNMLHAIISLEDKANNLKSEMDIYKLKICQDEVLDKKDFIKQRDSIQKSAKEIVSDYTKIKNDAVNFDPLGSIYETHETSLKTILKEINDELKLFLSVKLENYTPPLDVNGKNIDAVEITLNRLDTQNNNLPIDNYTYTIWVKGGLKIDVSGGIYISNLVNHEYYVETVTADSATPNNNKIIKERQKGNFDFGFGTSINISHRSASWINPTLNVGTMFTTNQQFQLLTGVGAILGKEERLIFSGGISMGRVTRIAENYSVDDVTKKYDLGTGSVPTSNVFGFGFYYGFTYNFTANKKKTNLNQQP